MSAIQFHLSFNNGAERLWLPVNPESIKVAKSHGFQDVEVTQLGEYTVIGNHRLKEFSFASFFPREYNPSYCEYEAVPNPWTAVNQIGDWMASGRPMRITIAGTPINEAVTVRSFTYDAERAGHPGDIFYEITFKEYVFVEFKKYTVTPASASASTETAVATAETARPDTTATPASHDVASGDTLWKIAQRTLGDGDRWREIYDANKDVIGANPNLITPGQTLVIP